MPKVVALTLFPVKSLRGQPVASASVEPWGLAGDRRFLVVDPDGRFLTQRQIPRMATVAALWGERGLVLSQDGRDGINLGRPGGGDPVAVTVWRDVVSAEAVGDAADQWLSAALDRTCRLVFMRDPAMARPVDPGYAEAGDHVSFADGFPLLLTSVASLDDLNARLEAPVPMDRFRPNLVVAGAAAWAEDNWRSVRIDGVRFDVVKPCTRCIVTTTDQSTGARHPDAEPIRTLQRFRRDADGQVLFGQNLIPRGAGTITIGATVEIDCLVGG